MAIIIIIIISCRVQVTGFQDRNRKFPFNSSIFFYIHNVLHNFSFHFYFFSSYPLSLSLSLSTHLSVFPVTKNIFFIIFQFFIGKTGICFHMIAGNMGFWITSVCQFVNPEMKMLLFSPNYGPKKSLVFFRTVFSFD